MVPVATRDHRPSSQRTGVMFDTSGGGGYAGTVTPLGPPHEGTLTSPDTGAGRKRATMGKKIKVSKVADLKPKKKCCRKKTRCLKCPVVVMRMKRVRDDGLSKKELRKHLERARAA